MTRNQGFTFNRLMAALAAAVVLTGCGGSGNDTLVQGTWRSRSPLPTPRQEMPSALLGGSIYTPGGMNAQGEAVATMEVYDFTTNTWTAAPPLPEGRHHAGIAAVNGRLYVIGGYLPGSGPLRASAAVFEFNPAQGVWTQKAPLPTARAAHACVEWNGKIYCIGGVQGTSHDAVGTNQVYDPITNTWATLAPMPTPREHLAAAVIGNEIFAVGGRSDATNNGELEVYAPGTNTWQSLPALPTPRSGLAAAALRGRLYVFGGENPGVFAQTDQYDPATRLWRPLAAMPTPRHGMGATAAGGAIYLIGGGTAAGLQISDVTDVFTMP